MLKNNLTVFTDGGARGNPGPAAIGVYITDSNSKEIVSFGKKIGISTNNIAEYKAVIFALDWVLSSNNYENSEGIDFYLDSKLIVNQLRGLYKIKESHLKKLVIEIRKKEKIINKNIRYFLVPREKNKIADILVNQALDI